MTFNLVIFLAALAHVESNTDDHAVGANGERGRYQITETVWHQWETMPHYKAQEEFWSFKVARRHIAWLHCNGVKATAYDTAVAWNCGLSAYKGNVPASSRKFARRVAVEYRRRITNNP
jgi:hypothetical protein